jgi:hypothetical protein
MATKKAKNKKNLRKSETAKLSKAKRRMVKKPKPKIDLLSRISTLLAIIKNLYALLDWVIY